MSSGWLTLAALAVLLLPAHGAIALEGDPLKGEAVYQFCYACHSLDPEERSLPGPNLHGVLGRRAAALEGFEYSAAMLAKGAEGLVWTRDALDRYLGDPEAMIPGTLMAVNGIQDAQARADLIAYIADAAR